MDRIYLLLIAMLFLNLSKAQTGESFFTTTLSPQIKDKDRRTDNVFLGSDNNGNVYFARTIISSSYKTTYVADKLDKNLKLVQTKELPFSPTNNNKTNINLDVFKNKANNKLYFLGLNDNGKNASISPLEIKIPDMTMTPTGKVLDDGIRHEVLAAVLHTQLVSPDSNIIAYVSQMNNDPSPGKYGSLLHASIFDASLNVKWTGDVDFPFVKGEAEIMDMCVGNDGYLNFVILSFPDKKWHWEGEYLNYSTAKWKLIRAKGQEVKTFDLSLKEGNISFSRITSSTDMITVTGIWCKGLDLNAKGVFSMRINTTGEVISSNTSLFPANFLTPNLKPGGATEKWLHWRWNMSRIFQLKNGGLAWAIEQHYVNNINNGENHCDLSELVVYIDKDNQITKTIEVPKIQTYYGGNPSAVTLLNDKIYVIYLDNPANAGKNDKAEIFANSWPEHKRDATTCVMVAEARPDGTYTKGVAVPASIENKYFIPGRVTNDGRGNLIVLSSYRSGERRV